MVAGLRQGVRGGGRGRGRGMGRLGRRVMRPQGEPGTVAMAVAR